MQSACFCTHLSSSWWQDKTVAVNPFELVGTLFKRHTPTVGFSLVVVFWRTHLCICRTTVHTCLYQSSTHKPLPCVIVFSRENVHRAGVCSALQSVLCGVASCGAEGPQSSWHGVQGYVELSASVLSHAALTLNTNQETGRMKVSPP